MRKGVVVNIDSTVNSIKKALEEAELMAGIKITGCLAGIAGSHIKSFNSNGVVAVKDKEVRKDDITRAVDAAKAVAIPADRDLLHVIPQEYIVDDQDGIKDPVGMSGVRLEVKVHIVTGSIASAQNIVKCCYLAGLTVDDLILGQLASAEATLTAEEKEIGVALVDVGGGTSDIAVYANGSIRHTSILPLGGNHITSDIAIGLRTPVEEAEKIKKKYGCALSKMVGVNETIEVPSVGGRKPRTLMRKTLADIIEPRVEEIITLIHEEIKKVGVRETTRLRGRHYRGVLEPGGTGRTRRERFQPASEKGLSHRGRGSRRRGEQSHIRDRGGPDPARMPGEQMEKRRL